MLVGTDRYIKPNTPENHFKYTFYTKISANGGSFAYFGPYYLDVGCTATSVTLTDSATFGATGVSKLVGDSVMSVYTFSPPTSSLAYCVIISSIVVTSDGSTPSTKLANCASQPCTVFSLIDTIHVETVTFKVKTTFTNNLIKVSPLVTTVITCSNTITITEVAAPTNPQYVTHGSATDGFILPTYQSS